MTEDRQTSDEIEEKRRRDADWRQVIEKARQEEANADKSATIPKTPRELTDRAAEEASEKDKSKS